MTDTTLLAPRRTGLKGAGRWLIAHYAACRHLTLNGGGDNVGQIVGILSDLESSCRRDGSLAAGAVRDRSAAIRKALGAVQQ